MAHFLAAKPPFPPTHAPHLHPETRPTWGISHHRRGR
jgi:hypothetical protein